MIMPSRKQHLDRDNGVRGEEYKACADLWAAVLEQAVLETIRSFDPKAVDRKVKDQTLGVLSDLALGNTPGNHPCRACLTEIEFIDVESVDKLLNGATTGPQVRAALAKALAKAILDDLKAA